MITPQLAGMLHRMLWWADHAVLVYFLALNSFYALLLLLSIPELWKHWRISRDEQLSRLLASDALPPLWAALAAAICWSIFVMSRPVP